jgi:hypothetical protein
MLHFSVRISTLERRLTELIQDVGINDVEAASVDAQLQVKSRAEQEQPL